MRQHLLPQIFRMRRADAVIDVETIWLCTNGNNLSAELLEYSRCQLISRAVRTVEDDLKSIKPMIDRRFQEAQVTLLRVLQHGHRAELAALWARQGICY